jgi:hypothetical protein
VNLDRDVRNYGYSVDDFELSPFELVDMLDLRSRLHENYNKLDEFSRQQLKNYDKILLLNAKEMYKALSSVYDFDNDKPFDEWWWHLDKVAQGLLNPDISAMYKKKDYVM